MNKFFPILLSAILIVGSVFTTLTADKDFLDTGHRICSEIVNEGQLVAGHTPTVAVRALSDSLSRFHHQLMQGLELLAGKDHISLSAMADTGRMKRANQLQTMTGIQFDTAWLRIQTTNQESLVELFQQESEMGRDSLAREFAKKSLPDLRRYQAMTTSRITH